MATDTETTEQEVPFEEQFGKLAVERREALRALKRHKDFGFYRGIKESTDTAAEAYAGMVSLVASHLLEQNSNERHAILENLGKIGMDQSFYGIESVGFNPNKFIEDVQKALEAAEEKVKEPNPV